MNIEFSRECLLDAAKEQENQFLWALGNFWSSKTKTDAIRWGNLASFIFVQFRSLLSQAQSAFCESDEIHEAANKTA